MAQAARRCSGRTDSVYVHARPLLSVGLVANLAADDRSGSLGAVRLETDCWLLPLRPVGANLRGQADPYRSAQRRGSEAARQLIYAATVPGGGFIPRRAPITSAASRAYSSTSDRLSRIKETPACAASFRRDRSRFRMFAVSRSISSARSRIRIFAPARCRPSSGIPTRSIVRIISRSIAVHAKGMAATGDISATALTSSNRSVSPLSLVGGALRFAACASARISEISLVK